MYLTQVLRFTILWATQRDRKKEIELESCFLIELEDKAAGGIASTPLHVYHIEYVTHRGAEGSTNWYLSGGSSLMGLSTTVSSDSNRWSQVWKRLFFRT